MSIFGAKCSLNWAIRSQTKNFKHALKEKKGYQARLPGSLDTPQRLITAF
jgi:hypothetical protein